MKKQITSEQLEYVRLHVNDRPRVAVARAVGLSMSSLYRLVRQLGGELRHELCAHNVELESVVRSRYPTMTASEIGLEYGLCPSTVRKWARRLGVGHTPETLERIRRGQEANRAKGRTEEASRKRAKLWKRRRRADELRVLSGLPQKTAHRFKKMPSRCYKAIWYYVNYRGYFQVDGEPFNLYYDGQTRRTPFEERAAGKYGIRFLPADGYVAE